MNNVLRRYFGQLNINKIGRFASIMLLLCLALLMVNPSYAQEITPRQMIIKTSQAISIRGDRTGLTDFDTFLNRLGAFNLRPLRGMPSERYYLVDLGEELDWQNLDPSQYSFGGIEYIQPNRLNKLHLNPNDPLFPLQQHHLCAVQEAWNYTTGSPLIVVGVIDSGVLREHPDLAANMYINPNEVEDGTDSDGNGYIDDWCGWDFADAPEMADQALGDFLDPDNDPTDENFHGTHVSGIIGAVGNNTQGIAGVCWNIRIMPLRAGFRTTQGSGYLQDDDAAAAIVYAADNGCHVINMSWGDPNYSPIIADACNYAYNKGVTLVASAGNDPGPILSYPAKLSSVISVGAVNKYKNLAGFSSYGTDLDLVAPGEQILSTYKNNPDELYMEMSGTSMSAPYVTGSIALLLSLQPGLSPQEVRARLLSSTEDIGTLGFDQFFGHGLLNTQRLLENLNPPIVNVTYPYDQLGVTEAFDIMGTVYGVDFFRYSVMYTTKSAPTALDWYDVASHTNQPQFYYQPVQNGVIASFNLMNDFPEGQYLIRIIYENSSGKKYHHNFTVRYDCSAPTLVTESLFGFKRYDKQNLRYYVSAKFSEAVHSELKIVASDGSVYHSHSAIMDSLQVWALSPTIAEGNIDISIYATNISNLVYQSETIPAFMNIQYEMVPAHGYVSTPVGAARVPLPRTFDFDGNGIKEYVSMDLPTTGYGNVSIMEPSPVGHIQTHTFNANFWPLDLGNTTGTEQEFLYLSADTAMLMKAKPQSVYPDTVVWSDTSISGGVIADFTGDGNKDLLMVKNLTNARVIQTYARNSSGVMVARNILTNNTPTSLRNTFVPTILVENLDNDAYPDIVTADTDGDLMIFEVYNNSNQNMTWTKRLPVGNTYYLCAGDFDGNGRKDFMAGGYFRDILNPDMNFWYFEAFKSQSDDSYTSMGNIMFNDILSQNAISAIDLDDDGKDEIVLAISPNLYVLKYVDGAFVPQWYGESFRTYQIASWRDADNKAYFLTNAKAQPDTVIAVQWTADIPFNGPATPTNFIATAMSANSVKLSWIDSGASYYRIYRKDENDSIIIFEDITGTEYTDTGLIAGKPYQYSIVAIDMSYTPSESIPSLWYSAIPNSPPLILSLSMVTASELRIIFDQRMPSSNLNPGLYQVDHQMGNPYTVNYIQDQHGFQLRFRDAFPVIDSSFVLTFKNVKGMTGVAATINSYSFEYIPDNDPPRVLSTNVMSDHKRVEIIFSEALHELSAGILSNYTLQSPSNDRDNSLVSLIVDADKVTLKLNEKLKYANQPYYIVVNGISDLAGNPISANHNIARFGISDIKDLSKVVTFPNPVRSREQQSIAFLNFPPNKKGSIQIYNSAADLVYQGSIGPFTPENNNITWRWNLKNNDNQSVSSGVYFYVIEMDGEHKRGKIALIR